MIDFSKSIEKIYIYARTRKISLRTIWVNAPKLLPKKDCFARSNISIDIYRSYQLLSTTSIATSNTKLEVKTEFLDK